MENISGQTSGSDKQIFLLFVSGMSVKSGHAIENLRTICDQYLSDRYELTIVDISKEKELAGKYQIIAIPTLLRTSPGPLKTIIGDLSDTQKVLRILDIGN